MGEPSREATAAGALPQREVVGHGSTHAERLLTHFALAAVVALTRFAEGNETWRGSVPAMLRPHAVGAGDENGVFDVASAVGAHGFNRNCWCDQTQFSDAK